MIWAYVKHYNLKELVIDEVDIMLDLGFRPQLINIFDLLPEKRQNIMFSATMTEEVDTLITSNFNRSEKVQITLSGTPLENISQTKYSVPNYHTKVNLLSYLLRDIEEMKKVLVFVTSCRIIRTIIKEFFVSDVVVIHSNKSQNYRFKSIKKFNEGSCRILTTDIIRGLDLDKISHVINFDTPVYPENYISNRKNWKTIKEKGKSILFFTEKREEKYKGYIEHLMKYEITELDFPAADFTINRRRAGKY